MFRLPLFSASAVGRVHSNRALKKLAGKPAFLKKFEHGALQPPQLEPLKWIPRHVVVPASGYLAPQGDVPADLPFSVRRTEKGKQLPVYSDFRHGGTKQLTLVRRIDGDVEVFKSEMSKVCRGAVVTERIGHVEVAGNYRDAIKFWLLGLGF